MHTHTNIEEVIEVSKCYLLSLLSSHLLFLQNFIFRMVQSSCRTIITDSSDPIGEDIEALQILWESGYKTNEGRNERERSKGRRKEEREEGGIEPGGRGVGCMSDIVSRTDYCKHSCKPAIVVYILTGSAKCLFEKPYFERLKAAL